MGARLAPWTAAGSVSATPPSEGISGGSRQGICTGVVARMGVAKAVSRLRLPPQSKVPPPAVSRLSNSPVNSERWCETSLAADARFPVAALVKARLRSALDRAGKSH